MTKSFRLMRGDPPDRDKHPIRFPIYVSSKFDGIRVGVKDGRTWTRSNKEVPNNFTRKLISGWEGIDSEFIVGPSNIANTIDGVPSTFEASNGAFRRFEGKPDFVLHAFDYLACDPRTPFRDRLAMLREKVSSIGHPQLTVAEQTLIVSEQELEEFYLKQLSLGYEGAMGKHPEGIYKYGSSTAKEQHLLKFKPWVDSEAIVLDICEAQTNLNPKFTNEMGTSSRSSHQENKIGNGMCGEIPCRDIYSGVEFNCSPSSMVHSERVDVWINREKYIGRIFTYKFVPIGVKDKPRLNGWVRWRDLNDIETTKADWL